MSKRTQNSNLNEVQKSFRSMKHIDLSALNLESPRFDQPSTLTRKTNKSRKSMNHSNSIDHQVSTLQKGKIHASNNIHKVKICTKIRKKLKFDSLFDIQNTPRTNRNKVQTKLYTPSIYEEFSPKMNKKTANYAVHDIDFDSISTTSSEGEPSINEFEAIKNEEKNEIIMEPLVLKRPILPNSGKKLSFGDYYGLWATDCMARQI